MLRMLTATISVWTVFGFLNLGFALPSTASKVSLFRSYKEWKQDRIQEANQKLSATRTKIESKKQDPNLLKTQGMQGTVPEVDRLNKQLRGEEMALELAEDLTVADYFVGYINRLQDRKAAIQEVAGKMTAEEVAELMSAYSMTMIEGKPMTSPVSADSHPIEQIR